MSDLITSVWSGLAVSGLVAIARPSPLVVMNRLTSFAHHYPFLFIFLTASLISWSCSSNSHPQARTQPSTLGAQDSFHLRALLANQPDFLADEIFTQFEARVHGGFSLGNKLAKKGDCYRSDSDGRVFFSCKKEPTVYFNPKKKTYREVPSNDIKWYQHGSHVQTLVNESNLTFEEIGAEEIDGHNCRKIKISQTSSDANDPTVFVYAAADLRNLVILVEIKLSDRTNRYFLRNVNFEVPGELFAPIERYNRPRVLGLVKRTLTICFSYQLEDSGRRLRTTERLRGPGREQDLLESLALEM